MAVKINNKILVSAAVILLMVFSFTKLTTWTTSDERQAGRVAVIDSNIHTVMELTAGSTAASAIITLLPGDQCTPIATELAELSKYFLLALSALYIEKYLITFMGLVSFKILIPVAAAVWLIGYLKLGRTFRIVSYKIAVCALAIYMVIPASVEVTSFIYNRYAASIDATINEATEICEEAEVETEQASMIERVTNWIGNKAQSTVEYVSGMLSHFIEALAVMIVTSCVLPVLVILFFIWMIKTVFAVNVPMIPTVARE